MGRIVALGVYRVGAGSLRGAGRASVVARALRPFTVRKGDTRGSSDHQFSKLDVVSRGTRLARWPFIIYWSVAKGNNTPLGPGVRGRAVGALASVRMCERKASCPALGARRLVADGESLESCPPLFARAMPGGRTTG